MVERPDWTQASYAPPSMGGLICALPLFWLLDHPSALLAQLGQLGLVLLIGVYNGALPAALVAAFLMMASAAVTFVTIFWFRDRVYNGALPAALVEAAPPTVRCTSVALGYNLCYGLFGGLSPFVATWLVERTGNEITPAFLMMASAAVTFVTIFWFRETYRTSFGVAPTTAV